jgi:hypothetical protein
MKTTWLSSELTSQVIDSLMATAGEYFLFVRLYRVSGGYVQGYLAGYVEDNTKTPPVRSVYLSYNSSGHPSSLYDLAQVDHLEIVQQQPVATTSASILQNPVVWVVGGLLLLWAIFR